MDMSIYTDMPFDDKEAKKSFLLDNSLSHALIGKTLEQLGKSINAYPLNEMGNEKDWLNNHNDLHHQELILVGINQDIDLADVDMKDKQQWYDWMQQHALIHNYVNSALGIVS
jgi:hypothetical protein